MFGLNLGLYQPVSARATEQAPLDLADLLIQV